MALAVGTVARSGPSANLRWEQPMPLAVSGSGDPVLRQSATSPGP